MTRERHGRVGQQRHKLRLKIFEYPRRQDYLAVKLLEVCFGCSHRRFRLGVLGFNLADVLGWVDAWRGCGCHSASPFDIACGGFVKRPFIILVIGPAILEMSSGLIGVAR